MRLIILTFVFLLWGSCATPHRTHGIYEVTVAKGDSLASIAARFDTTWQRVAKENNLRDSRDLKVGMKLRVRPGPGGIIVGNPTPESKVTAKKKVAGYNPAKFTNRRRTRGGFLSFIFGLWGSGDSKPKESNAQSSRGLLFGGRRILSWPLAGQLTSKFGMRRGRPHNGIDIAAPRRTAVRTSAAGKVTFVGYKRGYGKTVIVNHGRFKTLYAHLNRIGVRHGQNLMRRQIVGGVGRTGNATGYHLHFEVRDSRNRPYDPLPYLQRDAKLVSYR